MNPDIEIVNCDDMIFACFKTDDHISNTLRNTGEWENFETQIAKLVAKEFSKPLIFDIGANLGTFTVPVALDLANSNGSVYAFEPQRIIYQQLCTNIFLNRLDNVFANNVAIGKELKEIFIPKVNYEKTKNIGAVSLIPDLRKVTQVTYSEIYNEIINVISLDSVKTSSKCIFVKVDVEGYESEVFSGAINFFEEHNYPTILFEEWSNGKFPGKLGTLVEVNKLEARRILERLGYKLEKLNTNILAQHPLAQTHLVIKNNGGGLNISRER